MADASGSPPLVLAVSDATGETSEQAARAALAQFGQTDPVRIKVVGHVRSDAAIDEVLRMATHRRALIVYTFAEGALRARLAERARDADVPAVDLLGGLIVDISRYLSLPPLAQPGLGHETDEAYFRRIEAVEFSVQHDDGRNVQNLKHAEIVIVGISRTSKTPLSNYIAHRGYRVANIPLVREIHPPPELDAVAPGRVFALTMDPAFLLTVRRSRLAALGLSPDGDYADLDHIRREAQWARRLYRDHPGWTLIDTTGRAIEESAAEILDLYRSRFEPLQGPPARPGRPGGGTPARDGERRASRASSKTKTGRRSTARPATRKTAKAGAKKAGTKAAKTRKAGTKRPTRTGKKTATRKHAGVRRETTRSKKPRKTKRRKN